MYDNWEDLENSIKDCKNCKLCNGRKNIVFGVGNREADLMFIGEGPGGEEDIQGIPDKTMTTKELRKQLHLTQKQFAEEIGCSASSIFFIEASGRLPGKTIREKIKERYGVEVTAEERTRIRS